MYQLHKEIPVIGEYDIIVAGAGPAGICAAMAAARNGVKVALLERHGTVGGNLTLGHVGPIMGKLNVDTMAGEINRLLNDGTCLVHDMDAAKTKLMNWLDHENIELYLTCPVVDTIMEEGQINGVVVGTQSGMAVIYGKVVIDCTGDGVVSHLAGAPWVMGREGDGLCQPTTIMYTIGGIDPAQTMVCTHEADETILPNGKSYLQLCKDAAADGRLPKNVTIVRLYRCHDAPTKRLVNATQENYINALDFADMVKAERSLRNQCQQVVEFLRQNVWGFENCYIEKSADVVGVRESRRVMGDYVICGEDLKYGKQFPDTVVHNAFFCIDIHNPDGGGQAEEGNKPFEVEQYDLPYRAFVPLNVDALYTCGRCISGTHRAHASYRVMNTVLAMGQAIGLAASLCIKENVLPRNLEYSHLREALIASGVILD